jgi:hypothetical protein
MKIDEILLDKKATVGKQQSKRNGLVKMWNISRLL